VALCEALCQLSNVTRDKEFSCVCPYLVAHVLTPGGIRVLLPGTVGWVFMLAVFTEDRRLTPIRRVSGVP
jgi:hypothetical protein